MSYHIPIDPILLALSAAPLPTTANTPAMPSAPSDPPAQTPAPSRCHPPDLERKNALTWRQKDWSYVCDVCGHPHGDRPSINRHMRFGALRPGFKIISADPENDPHWYGLDEAANEYMGDIIARTENKRKGSKRVPPPCGPRMVAFEKGSKRLRSKQAKEKVMKEKAEEKSRGDDEGGDEQASRKEVE